MIGFLAELTRWALILVFAAAVVGKLVWPDGLTGLGTTLKAGLHVPARLAVPAATALVVAEAVVAVLLVVPVTLTAGLLAAGLLSAAMTAGTVVLARRTEALPCRCFGSGSTPVTWSTVLRNAGLTAVAAGALALSGLEDGRDAGLAVSLAALMTAAALLLAGRQLALRAPRGHSGHQHGAAGRPVTLPPNGPDIGSPAPAVPGTVPPRAGGIRLIAFASATCQGCRDGLPKLVAYARLLGGRDRVVVAIVGDSVAGADIEAAVSGVARVIADERADGLAGVYGIAVFPTYVLVDDGLVEAVTLSVNELPRPVR
ncbi:MauE/DoxX family redox-associated membrane protein [Jiangella alkaliphila]|uniref:Methylamine utilisation protein MauE domain-containing protein n=1 Tax=Jiangella alkaliphila TaxID=419479 RepID=A0A1H2LJ51_9ACTN|nr:MauE/DoxX family redox-associated membrane protein [Jiangella alkaliphila]SDU81063.1 hypothetical protein SAMN04488563_6264 [Jiangella alkaliphila]